MPGIQREGDSSLSVAAWPRPASCIKKAPLRRTYCSEAPIRLSIGRRRLEEIASPQADRCALEILSPASGYFVNGARRLSATPPLPSVPTAVAAKLIDAGSIFPLSPRRLSAN